jgi:predicted transcriptional regulator
MYPKYDLHCIIKKLEASGLIEINTSVGRRGIQKVCYLK